jgi:predicted nucleic acid-binding Zn ribbon protein
MLNVYVDHPGWLPELERMKRILLQKLQAQYPDLRIRQLYFVLTHR